MDPIPIRRPRVRARLLHAARAQRKAPRRFTPSTRSHCSSVNSSRGPRSSTPAFKTTTSGGPSTACTSVKNRPTACESDTSQRRESSAGTDGTLPEAHTATRAPAVRSAEAQASPMPREAPVTTQILSRKDRSSLRAAGKARAKLRLALERARPGFHGHAALPAHGTAHLHAAMLGSDYDARAQRRKRLHDRPANPMDQVLLQDEPVRERVDRLRDLAESDQVA